MYEWHTWWTCQVRGVSRYSKGFWIALPRVCNQRDEQDGLLKSLFSWGKRNRNLGPLRDYETFFFKWRRFPHLRILVILGVVLSLTYYYYSISEHILSISYRNYIHYMNVRNSVSLSLSRPHDSILQTKSMNLWCILWSIFKSNLSCFNSRSLHFMTTWPRHNR